MKAQRAHQIVLEYLSKKDPSFELELVIEAGRTIRRPYGWIVFYNSKKYLEGDSHAALYGNGPLVVLIDGRVIQLGTGGLFENRVAVFEEKLFTCSCHSPQMTSPGVLCYGLRRARRIPHPRRPGSGPL